MLYIILHGVPPQIVAAFLLHTQESMASRKKTKYWSAEVMRKSNALDLEKDVFKNDSPAEIARSLKRSAERSQRRKAEPFRSAMSMLNFYINRAGKNLPAARRRTLENAKDELRRLFQREVEHEL